MGSYQALGWSVIRPWLRPSRRGCLTCHARALGFAIWAALAIVLSWLAPPAAMASVWSSETLPVALVAGGDLLSISCPTPRACVAVGWVTGRADNKVPLAERWDGSTWAVTATPVAFSGVLNAVSCSTQVSCVGVGTGIDARGRTSLLIERWSGSVWTRERGQLPRKARDASLSGVSCIGHECRAVGAWESARGQGAPLVERWNDRRWIRAGTPVVHGSYDTVLTGISCPSRRACIAVGYFDRSPDAGASALAERWDGSRWTLARAPRRDRLDNEDYRLLGISCTSRHSCLAVGVSDVLDADGENALVERWDGSTWSVPEAGLGTGDAGLTGVSCVSARACTAVGQFASAAATAAWNGHRWRWTAQPLHNGVISLDGISCAGAGECTVVGTGNGAVIQRQTGSRWVGQPGPPNTPASTTLNAVSCVSPVWCMAVGSSIAPAGTPVAVAEWWNGSTWATAPMPASLVPLDLRGVACTSTSWCVAVGDSGGPPLPSSRTLAETWNGTTWTLSATPNPPGPANDSLDAVSCASASACIAVGSANSDTSALAEAWDGANWSLQSIPSTATGSAPPLHAISCAAASACVAVGDQPSAAAWDGTSWTTLTVPDPGGSQPLTGVSCTSAMACIAVGGQQIDALSGSTWTVQQFDTTPPFETASALSCRSASACTAVGDDSAGHVTAQEWDGMHWTIQAGINPAPAQHIALDSVSCAAPNNCLAVGTASLSGNTDSTLDVPIAYRYR